MYLNKGGLIAKTAVKQNKNFNFSIFLFLWIAGIFLFSNIASAAAITPQNIINLTNRERERYGLDELFINEKLTRAAEKKAEDLLAAQTFSHNFNDKKFSQWIKDENYNYMVVGENLGINFNDDGALFNAWLASPTHKKNILHQDYKEIGVAVVSGSWLEDKASLVVQLFGTPANSFAMAKKQTVAGEQSVPTSITALTAGSNNYFPAAFTASNLSESYLRNIIGTELNTAAPTNKKFYLNFNFNKKENTALKTYILVTAQLIIIYTATALLLLLFYFYINYFSRLIKKLNIIDSLYKI